jgi:hypothetical protein
MALRMTLFFSEWSTDLAGCGADADKLRASLIHAASVRSFPSGELSCEFQGTLQMIFDLRQGVASELPEIGVGAMLDLLLEQRRISLLIRDLAVHIIPVKRGPVLCVERSEHRVISALQERVRGRDIFTFQGAARREREATPG